MHMIAKTLWLVSLPLSQVLVWATKARSIPAILDTDIGTFIDDSFALAQVLKTVELDLRLVITASDDTVGRARVLAKFLDHAGVSHIPIGIGVPTSNATGALYGWAADYPLSAYRGGVHKDGVDAMRQVVDTCGNQTVVIIEIGPHTNAQHLIERFPYTQQSIKIVAMGGSIAPGIRLPWGHVTPVNTTNERKDPAAARALVRGLWAQTPIFAPVDTSFQVVLRGRLWQQILQSTDPVVQLLLQCYRYWWQESRRDPSAITHKEAMSLDPDKESAILFDTEAVHLSVSTRHLLLTELHVDFTEYGRTLLLPPESSLGGPTKMALNWTQVPHEGLNAFLQHLASVLQGPKTAPPTTGIPALAVVV